MKKGLLVAVLLMSFVFIISGCAKEIADDKMPKTNGAETMEKEEMIDDTMEKEDMTEDTMEKEDMSDDTTEKEDISEDNIDEMAAEMAPGFTLMDTEGNTHSLSDYKGEKVYLKFWASWCPICLDGLSATDELSGQDEGFKVLTVVTPSYGGEKKQEKFIEWFDGLETENMIVLLDVDGKLAIEYGVRAMPTSAYIDSKGGLVTVLPGHVNNETVIAKFNEIN